MTGSAATIGMLSQTTGAPAVSHLMCSIAEHHQLVCHLLVFLL